MNARILLVSSVERRPRLFQLLNAKGLEIYTAAGIGEARRRLNTTTSFDVLFVDAADGFWQELTSQVLNSQRTCQVVVYSRWVDAHLWAEVINCGAFDLVAEPCDESEILRIFENALKNQYIRNFGRAKSAKVSELGLLSATEPVARTG